MTEEVLYRLNDYNVSVEDGAAANFFFDEPPPPPCDPVALKVWRRTPKGAWVQRDPWSREGDEYDKPVFVLNDAVRRHAYPTKKEAVFAYVKRKEKHVQILAAQHDRAKARLRHAQKALEAFGA